MSSGKRLSEYERGKIDGLRLQKKTSREIAKILKRSKTVVNNYLKLKENYGKQGRRGRKKILSKRVISHIGRICSNKIVSASKIKSELGLVCSVRTVRRTIRNIPHLVYSKLQKKPKLTKIHIEQRLRFSQDSIKNRLDFEKIVFSDEKKFNLDGPDGFAYYWHDLRKEKQFFSKRQSGGGSVMVWGGFGYGGKTELVFLEGRVDSEQYVDVLKNHLLRAGKKICGKNWIFQQDNASVHTSKLTLDWLKSKKVNFLDWPSKSPDLNPIENLWGILVRKVYANGKQYNSVDELKTNLVKCWTDIELEILSKLVDSMPNRIMEVIRLNGKATKY